jgi:hypothetical protein
MLCSLKTHRSHGLEPLNRSHLDGCTNTTVLFIFKQIISKALSRPITRVITSVKPHNTDQPTRFLVYSKGTYQLTTETGHVHPPPRHPDPPTATINGHHQWSPSHPPCWFFRPRLLGLALVPALARPAWAWTSGENPGWDDRLYPCRLLRFDDWAVVRSVPLDVRISLPDPSLFSLSQDDVVWAIITLTPRPPSQHNSLPVHSVSLLYKGIR